MVAYMCRCELPKGYSHLIPLDYPDSAVQGYGTPPQPPRSLLASGRLHLLCYKPENAELSLYRLKNGTVKEVWSEEFHPDPSVAGRVLLAIPYGGPILLVHDGYRKSLHHITTAGRVPCDLEPPNCDAPLSGPSGGGMQVVPPVTHGLLMPWIHGGEWHCKPTLIFYRQRSGDSHINYGPIEGIGWGWSDNFVMVGAAPGLTSLSYIGTLQRGFPTFLIAGATNGAVHFYARDYPGIGDPIKDDISQQEYNRLCATGWKCHMWRWIGCYESPQGSYTDVLSLDDRPQRKKNAVLYDRCSGRYELVQVDIVVSGSGGALYAERFEIRSLAAGHFGTSSSHAVAATLFHSLVPGAEDRTGWLFRYTAADGLLDVDNIPLT